MPATEKFFQWKELKQVEGEDAPRLLTPWSDPMEYEHPMDWMFATVGEAEAAKEEHAPDETWYLVVVTMEPVGFYGMPFENPP